MNRVRPILIQAAALAAILTASTAHAAPIFTQSPAPTNGFPSDLKGEALIADDFSIATADTARSVSWLGAYASSNTAPAVDDFEVRFYADMGGAPGALLQTFDVGNSVNRTVAGSLATLTLYSYAADLGSGFSIGAATPYWLVIVNDTTGDPDDAWYWGVQSPGNAHISLSGNPFVPTQNVTGATSFTLDNAPLGAVPEPASVLLVGLGLATTALRRRFAPR